MRNPSGCLEFWQEKAGVAGKQKEREKFPPFDFLMSFAVFLRTRLESELSGDDEALNL